MCYPSFLKAPHTHTHTHTHTHHNTTLGALSAVHDFPCLLGMADRDGHETAGQQAGISAGLEKSPRVKYQNQGVGWGGVGWGGVGWGWGVAERGGEGGPT